MTTPASSIGLGFIAYKRGFYDQAVHAYRDAAKSSFLDAESKSKFAASLLVEGSVGDAKVLIEQILREEPLHFRASALLGCGLELSGDVPLAAATYRRSLQVPGVDGAVITNLSYLLITMGHSSTALELLSASMALPPTLLPRELVAPSFDEKFLPRKVGHDVDIIAGSACALLGIKLQESGKLEQARVCYVRAIELHPLGGNAFYNLVRTQKIDGKDQSLLDSIEQTLANPALANIDRNFLHYALGKAFDDLGEYERAISHIDEANKILRQMPGPSFDKSQFENLVDHTIRTFKKTDFEKMSAGSSSDMPIEVVGMMRSGTTLVEQILSSHQKVAAGDELSFWKDHGFSYIRKGSRLPSPDQAQLLALEYLKTLQNIGLGAERVTDKMPYNFIGLGLIHRIFPEARLLCCKRHPVDTCLSIYMTAFPRAMPYATSREEIAFFYRQFSRITAHWGETLPSNRYLTVSYEALLLDREKITRQMIDFCGLEWDDFCLSPQDNPRSVKTASLWQVRQPVYQSSNERWRRYERWLGPFAEFL